MTPDNTPPTPRLQPAARTILHVDMDAFYASVETRDNPELNGKPLIVGGRAGQRGVVAAANYAARRYGIHSAMPTAIALQRCPHVVLLPPRLSYYSDISQQIRAIFGRYTPLIEPLSLDEAFLDVSSSMRLFGSAAAIGHAIRKAIETELQLPCSIGIGPNKFIAKIASDLEKPHGFVEVTAEDALSFLAPLPISRLWGVGRVTEQKLRQHGIEHIGDLRRQQPEALASLLGRTGTRLWQLAHAIDDRPVVPDRQAKSISHETTFAVDIDTIPVLRDHLRQLTEAVCMRLRTAGKRACRVQIHLRDGAFRDHCHSTRLPQPTDSTRTVWQHALTLFRQGWDGRPLRLIGIGVDDLTETTAMQGELFGAPPQRQQQVDRTLDAISRRFGRDAVRRGVPHKHD